MLLTVALAVALGAAGTVSYLNNLDPTRTMTVTEGAIALCLASWLTWRRAWARTGFARTLPIRGATVAALALAVALVALPWATSTYPLATGTGWAPAALLALLVAFVEETIYRGILPNCFPGTSKWARLLVPSIAFALAHAITAISPEQDPSAIARTIAFAFTFGLLAALLRQRTGTIWITIAIHATFDTGSLIATPRNLSITDTLEIAVALAATTALALAYRLEHRGERRNPPHN